MTADAKLRAVAAQMVERLHSDEAQALDRFLQVLTTARADPLIARSQHVKMLVEYLADVAEHRWRELLNGDGVGALREVVNEQRRIAAARPRKGVTCAELFKFRDAFVARHGTDRGWKAGAQAHFGIGAKAIAKRLAGN